MTSDPNLDEVVHRRTEKGQQAVISSCNVLEPAHKAVLLLFNGFTPTAVLLRMVAPRYPNASTIAGDLESEGLIAQV